MSNPSEMELLIGATIVNARYSAQLLYRSKVNRALTSEEEAAIANRIDMEVGMAARDVHELKTMSSD